MIELFSLALEIQDICRKNGWPFCIIGGLAVQHWGEPRFTRDVDLTILTGFGDEEPVIDGGQEPSGTRQPAKGRP